MTDADRIVAEYLIETPAAPEAVAETMAAEQSSGTLSRISGRIDRLRAQAAAEILSVEQIDEVEAPSLHSAYLVRKGVTGPYRRARVRLSYPTSNIGQNLPTLAATVSGNLYDLGEMTGLKLVWLSIPRDYRRRYPQPSHGVAGTRQAVRVRDRPVFGTVIKPNLGMRAEDIAALVDRLCAAGVDFIKDDEICANPEIAPLSERVPAVMEVIRKWQDLTDRKIMVAFNVTDEACAMRRHADLVAAEGGSCVMASLNWCGLSGIAALRAHTPLAIHAHRNGFGALSRHPLLGMGFQPYQSLYRLAGIDHMHVHGIGGKFADTADEVTAAARACLSPLSEDGPDDAVMPVFSSGQWAGTLPETLQAAQGSDLMFLCGSGVLDHPSGLAAGVASLREAYDALRQGLTLEEGAHDRPSLSTALRFFGG
ncbi:RuBisCO large subunit C-terminal-like domain-containing protein [Paracoccus sediminicola]|uniref:RuBisCO large subunit C-terminal-like domain-containing protein n=1 Tax=Paracoccus sediminicola TaxID=3017783 RepID=UPI0022F057B9|nr:RuBisCO large subunit C-terminal-like domain-containing protein [Paracoccus sediminicola]WBU56096.1 RuBisCO large subunit C-terminal-like domain-containing protein [Paracoccus sediminicola]